MDQAKIDKALEVRTALTAVENKHPGSREVLVLHKKLGDLLNMFAGELPSSDMQAMGGGSKDAN